VTPRDTARRLRRRQTPEERQLWQALRAGRFAGFKFRRQHPLGEYYLDFYCADARLSIELDGSQHGSKTERQHDAVREKVLAAQGIAELRFWNRQWHCNREGVLLEIWDALHARTGCTQILRMTANNRFVPPSLSHVIPKRPAPPGWLPKQ
jgi:very-short-patch-repair endonuclease